MKSLQFFILMLVVSVPLSFAAEVQVMESSETFLPVAGRSGDGGISFDAGVKVSSKYLEACAITGIGSETFRNLSSLAFGEFMELQKPRFGARIRVPFRGIPVNLRVDAGTLSYSGGISRLRSPSIVWSSALKKSTSFSPGTVSSLPSLSTGEQPFSVGFCLVPERSSVFIPSVQAAVFEDGSVIASVSKKMSFSFLPSCDFSVSGGSFDLERTPSSSWFQDEIPFPCRRCGAFDVEMNLMFPHFRLSQAAGFHQSPMGGVSKWFRSQNSLLAGNFTLNMAGFCSDSSIILVSGGSPHIKCQFVVNPQWLFKAGIFFIDAGVSAEADFRESKKRVPVSFNEYTGRAAVSVSSGGLWFQLSSFLEYSTQAGDFLPGVNLSVSKNFKPVSVKCSASYRKESASKDSVSVSLQVSPAKKGIPCVSSGVSLSDVSGNPGGSARIGVNWLSAGRRLRVSVKNSVEFRF